MKYQLIVLTVFFCLSLSGKLFAYESMGSADLQKQAGMEEDMRVATEEDVKNLLNVGNKLCPVSGNSVNDGSMGEAVRFVYNGKIYNLCCSMCVKDFKKDPEKYKAAAEQEVKEVK